MDVTCERCGTEYDFDDALVSERGTTVKCTNCGAQFRVFRPVPATGPERWVVRTVDGRELTFSALRELQAAISTGVVGRDDVLSRGGGRPRRLGSIAELEPFFKQAVIMAATSTAPGLGLPSARAHRSPAQQQEPSVAIPLPRAPEDPLPKRSGTLPPPPPILNMPPAADRSEVRATSGHAAQGRDGRPLANGASDPINTAVTGSMQTTSVAAGSHAARLSNLVAADLAEPITVQRSDARGMPLTSEGRAGKERTPAVPIGPSAPAHAPPPVVVSPSVARGLQSDATIQDNGPSGFADTIAALGETVTQVDGSAAREPSHHDEPPPREAQPAMSRARKPDESGVVEKRAAPIALPAPEPAQRSRPPMESRLRTASIPPITPSPGEVRGSYIPDPEPSVSPRFSMAASTKRNSSVRWIVGVVLIGATALLAATVGRKYLVAPPPAGTAAPAADDRVAKLLDEGEKSLREGDLESAKEKFDKASALAENDPQVAAHLAHLAVVRADLRWLKVRVLPPGPEATVAQAELTDSIEKMKKSVEAARTLLPSDPAVRRYRVDALRIAGDRAGARALVAELASAGKTPEDDLALAALDLAEEKPAWPTVIERLRTAAAADGNLGRARAMLVYALASSGDIAGAKAEHDRLAAMTRPHPLTVPLLAFMARLETDRPAASGSAKTSSAAAPTPVASGGGAATAPSSAGGSGTSPSGTQPGGRIADDYVAPNAGTVDVSDMGHHPPPQPTAPPSQTAPTPAPTPTPTTPPTPPSVDTSDLPGFGKP